MEEAPKLIGRAVAALCAVVLPLQSASAQHAPDVHADYKRQIEAKDGVVTIPDRSIACRIEGPSIACDNGNVSILCKGETCTAYPNPADGPNIASSEATKPGARVIPAKTVLQISGGIACFVDAKYIECNLPDYLGGFAISGYFARVYSYADAPPGWPWVKGEWSIKDRVPGV